MANVVRVLVPPPPPPLVEIKYSIELSQAEADGLITLLNAGVGNATVNHLHLAELRRALEGVGLKTKINATNFISTCSLRYNADLL